MAPLAGHLRDPVGRRAGVSIRRTLGASPYLPAACSLERFAPAPIEQAGQSCVGAALAAALATRASVIGQTITPSYLAIYALARELESPSSETLDDAGSYPYRAIDGLLEWGIVDERRWPASSDTSARVPIDVLEAGASALVTGVYHVDDTGPSRLRAIRAALSCGHPVFFGMTVDRSYMRCDSDRWYAPSGPAEGGHAQVIVGYDADAFRVHGSWGTTWADGGRVWIDQDWIMSENAFDFYALTAAPSRPR